jgi:thioredoxin-related protein
MHLAAYRKTILAAAMVSAQLCIATTTRAAELLMFERDGCVWCQRWNREIGPVYDKTDEAKVLPLRRIDVDRDKATGVTLESPVRWTPTFVVIDEGREIARIVGYSSDESFWGLLGKLAAKLRPAAERT